VQRRVGRGAQRDDRSLVVRSPFAGHGLNDNEDVEDPVVEEDLPFLWTDLHPCRRDVAGLVDDVRQPLPRVLS
jgi:hypothetical protein